MPIIILLYFL